MSRHRVVAAAAIVIAIGVLLWARSTVSDARVRVIESNALAEVALDTAAAIRSRIDALLQADSIAEQARADSAAAWEARVSDAEGREAEAREVAVRASSRLREHLEEDGRGVLDSLLVAHEQQLESERVRTAAESARADRAEAAEQRYRLLFGESEARADALQEVVRQYEIGLDARDAVITGLQTEKAIWQGVAVLGVGFAGAQLLGLIG